MAELAKIPIEGAEYQAGFAPQLPFLQQHYTIVDNHQHLAEGLREEPALSALLIEAVKPLQNAFGEGRVIQLRAQASDDDSFLQVAVQLPQILTVTRNALCVLSTRVGGWTIATVRAALSYLTTRCKMPFDWREFLIVAHSLRNDLSEAAQRTSLGRAYYYTYNLGLARARMLTFNETPPGLHKKLWNWC